MRRTITLLAVVLLFRGTYAGRASQYVVSNDAPTAGDVIRIDQPGVLDQPGAISNRQASRLKWRSLGRILMSRRFSLSVCRPVCD